METEPPTQPVMAEPKLSFISLNNENPTTIVLLHGAGSCGLEYAHVIPHLRDYHLLVPDLPGHSSSRAIKPATIDSSASHVADLIRSEAHGGKAHVVGLSMGGFIGQRLALESPSLVLSLFVTGASPFQGWTRWMAEHPFLIHLTMASMIFCLPNAVYWWAASLAGLKRHEELLAEMRANWSQETTAEVYGSIAPFQLADVGRLKVRTLAVAGGKQDDVAMIAEMGRVLKERPGPAGETRWPEDGSGAVVVRDAVHAWDMQHPELFGNGVVAWISQAELPAEYERL